MTCSEWNRLRLRRDSDDLNTGILPDDAHEKVVTHHGSDRDEVVV